MNDTKLPTMRPGRRKRIIPPKSSEKVREDALSLYRSDWSYLKSTVLELLLEYFALTEDTLFTLVSEKVEISPNIDSFSRTLRNYVKDDLIAYVSYDVLKRATRAGLPAPDGRRLKAFRLASTGEAYLRLKKFYVHRTYDDGIAHDLICSEAMLRMKKLWLTDPKSPGLAEVRGPGSLFVFDEDEENKSKILAPDGLLVKHTLEGVFQRAFVVEYHNVNTRIQARKKIAKYEQMASPEYAWVWDKIGLDKMPIVLALYRQEAMLDHYRTELKRRTDEQKMLASAADDLGYKEKTTSDEPAIRVTYASVSLTEIWNGKLVIKVIKP